MSIDASEPGQFDDVTGTETGSFPEPRAHGAAVMNQFADIDSQGNGRDRGTLYDRSLEYNRDRLDDRDVRVRADQLPGRLR